MKGRPNGRRWGKRKVARIMALAHEFEMAQLEARSGDAAVLERRLIFEVLGKGGIRRVLKELGRI